MPESSVRLSILDQTPVIEGSSVADAIAATDDLAQMADQLGYHRYWCAEHHGSLALANPAPEIMVARLAAATKRMRAGSGGIMLPYYSPWKVAEQFLLLEALFPGRIDLGLGRAPGGDQRTAKAVAGGQPSQRAVSRPGSLARRAARRRSGGKSSVSRTGHSAANREQAGNMDARLE